MRLRSGFALNGSEVELANMDGDSQSNRATEASPITRKSASSIASQGSSKIEVTDPRTPTPQGRDRQSGIEGRDSNNPHSDNVSIQRLEIPPPSTRPDVHELQQLTYPQDYPETLARQRALGMPSLERYERDETGWTAVGPRVNPEERLQEVQRRFSQPDAKTLGLDQFEPPRDDKVFTEIRKIESKRRKGEETVDNEDSDSHEGDEEHESREGRRRKRRRNETKETSEPRTRRRDRRGANKREN